MTDKEKIKAEVQKWINNRTDSTHVAEADIVASKRYAYQDVLNFINSLPEESVSKDLEEAAADFAEGEWEGIHDNDGNPLYDQEYVEYAFKAGAQWQKEQIMANTTDAMIGLPYENKDGKYTQLIDVSRPLPVGNNKITIIFKED